MLPVRQVTFYGATTEKDPQISPSAFSFNTEIASTYPRGVIVTDIGPVCVLLLTASARQCDPPVVVLGCGSSPDSLANCPVYPA